MRWLFGVPHNSADWFGYSVSSAMGSLAVVGAPNASCPAGDCGSTYPANTGLAYEYTAPGWTTPGIIYPANGGSGDLFGYSVATSGNGDYVVVGAPIHGSGQGEGYFFTPGYWGANTYNAESQRVTNSSYGEFGWSVASYQFTNRGSAVFGAPVTNNYTGAAYLYDK